MGWEAHFRYSPNGRLTVVLEYAIIRGMKPIATANYDFESLIKGGYVYGRVLLDAQCAVRMLRNFLH